MTFAVAGLCRRTGMLGVAVTTSSICVGSRCPWVRAGVGAVSTQNVTLPTLGPMVLDELEHGIGAEAALTNVMAGQPHADHRQVVVVDRQGACVHFSGAKTLDRNAIALGQTCIAAGNLLKDMAVPQAIVDAFEAHEKSHLAERLLIALESGQNAGGEEGPVHSAALLVADKHPWPLVNLRVDWDEADPLLVLRSLWTAYQPQMDDYVTRAIDPSAAPSYGVPGDE